MQSETNKGYRERFIYQSSYANTIMFGLSTILLTSSSSPGELVNTSSNAPSELGPSQLAKQMFHPEIYSGNFNYTADIEDESTEFSYQIKKIQLIEKIDEFLELEEGWNGYKSQPIDKEVLTRAKNTVLKLQGIPHVFPTGRNSVQIEYEDFETGNYLEVEIFSDRLVCYYENALTENYEEFQVENVQDINKVINNLNVA